MWIGSVDTVWIGSVDTVWIGSVDTVIPWKMVFLIGYALNINIFNELAFVILELRWDYGDIK